MPTVTFPVTTGQTYYLAVDGEDGSIGAISLSCADIGGGSGGELPPGALGMLDFLNGFYKWDTTDYLATDIIDHPEYIVPGVGMLVNEYQIVDPFDDLLPAQLLDSPFLDHILSGDFTVVAEVYGEGDSAPLFVYQAALTAGAFRYESVGDSYILFFDLDGGTHEVELDQTTSLGVPKYNIHAMSRSSSPAGVAARVAYGEFAGSVHADRTGTSLNSWAPTTAYIGGNQSSVFNSMIISRMVFYPLQDDADLGTLLTDPLLTAPANDDFTDAIAITLGQTLSGHNILATKEIGEPDHAGALSTDTVWWKYTAESSGSRTVNITSAGDFMGWGAAIGVYTGADVDSLSEVASNVDWPGVSVTFSAVSGTTYYFAVCAAGNSTDRNGGGPITINLTT